MLLKQELAQERFDICKQCSNFTALNTCDLTKEGLVSKVKIAWTFCPDLKWHSRQFSPQDHTDVADYSLKTTRP